MAKGDLGPSQVNDMNQTSAIDVWQADEFAGLARRGESAAFAVLYEESASRVYDLCLRMSGSPVEAEDLTQEVYVRCWEKLSLFRGESLFYTWLHRLAINLVLNKLQRADRIASIEFAVDDIDRFGSSRDSEAAELRIDLERALSTLSVGARRTLMQKYVGGFEHQEIANEEGVAVGSIRSRVCRARRALVAALGPSC